MSTGNNEPKLTKDMYHMLLKHIEENKANASKTLMLHIYLSVIYFIDVDGQAPTLLGFIQQLNDIGMPIPDELQLFD